MISRNNILAAGLLALCVISCSDQDIVKQLDALTIQGYMHPADSMATVTLGRIIPFYVTDSIEPPLDLVPVIVHRGGSQIQLELINQDGLYGTHELEISEGEVFGFSVAYGGVEVTAETQIPPAPENVQLSESLIYRVRIDDFSDFAGQGGLDPIEINWDGQAGAYYFVVVETMEDDPEPINSLFDDERVGPPRLLTEPSNESSYTIDQFREITHFGEYRVEVFRVNPEYVALYEDNTDGASSLNEIRTNVQNGFGIFTGINSTVVHFEVKPQ